MMKVQHHVKYEEIHGYDEVVMMDKGEHARLHHRLRCEGKCSISPAELDKISTAAHSRTNTGKLNQARCSKEYKKKNIKSKSFYDLVDEGIYIAHRISLNLATGSVFVEKWFNHPKRDILFIDIPMGMR